MLALTHSGQGDRTEQDYSIGKWKLFFEGTRSLLCVVGWWFMGGGGEEKGREEDREREAVHALVRPVHRKPRGLQLAM